MADFSNNSGRFCPSKSVSTIGEASNMSLRSSQNNSNSNANRKRAYARVAECELQLGAALSMAENMDSEGCDGNDESQAEWNQNDDVNDFDD